MLRFLVWTALIIGAIVGLLRLTVIRWVRLPSDDPILTTSLAPTLNAGDLILTWRGSEPKFGSLVICDDPEEPGRVVIGRIMGEGGDHVVVAGSDAWVNDHGGATEYACASPTFTVVDPHTGTDVEQHCDVLAIGGVSHMRGSGGASPALRQKSTHEVPPGHVFLLSDNRSFPLDSREFGPVARSTCRESIFFRLVSRYGYGDEPGRLTYIR
jgi:signal peptidase I